MWSLWSGCLWDCLLCPKSGSFWFQEIKRRGAQGGKGICWSLWLKRGSFPSFIAAGSRVPMMSFWFWFSSPPPSLCGWPHFLLRRWMFFVSWKDGMRIFGSCPSVAIPKNVCPHSWDSCMSPSGMFTNGCSQSLVDSPSKSGLVPQKLGWWPDNHCLLGCPLGSPDFSLFSSIWVLSAGDVCQHPSETVVLPLWNQTPVIHCNLVLGVLLLQVLGQTPPLSWQQWLEKQGAGRAWLGFQLGSAACWLVLGP